MIARWEGVLALRPLLSLSLLAIVGTSIGLEVSEAVARDRARGIGAVTLGALGIALAVRSWRRGARPSRRSGGERAAKRSPLSQAAAAFVLFLLHGLLAAPVPRPRVGESPTCTTRETELVLAAREAVIAGRWRSIGTGEHGWVEAVPGVDTPPLADRILFECELVPPGDGDWVQVLPGGECVPWPRGPVPGPTAREGRFLARSRIAAEELVRYPSTASSVATVGRGWLRARLRELRSGLVERTRALESEGPARGLVAALLVGDRSGLTGDTVDRFTRTGTRHLLALSGLHVGLVVGTLLLPLTGGLLWLPLRGRARLGLRRFVTLSRFALLGLYLLAAGLADPVTRAGAALAMALLAPLLRTPGGASWERGRTPDGLSIWSTALLAEVLLDPLGLRSLSLRLSYLATLGILLGAAPLALRLRALARGLGSDRRERRSELHRLGVLAAGPRFAATLLLGRVGGWWLAGVAASIAAVTATFPEVAQRFGEWSPVGWLATPLLVPPIAVLLASGWLALATGLPGLVDLPAALAEAILAGLALADRLPGTPTSIPPRPGMLLWTLVALLGLGAIRSRGAANMLGDATGDGAAGREAPGVEPRRRIALRLAAWLGALLLLPWTPAPAALEVHGLDVGHGTCVVARAPGLPALVFDAGSRSRHGIHREALGPLLAAWEVDRPWVVLTHDHRDHRSDLRRLVERTAPRGWLGTLPDDLAGLLPADTRRVDTPLGRTRVALGDVEGHLLRGLEAGGNEGSRSLELHWEGRRVLLTGDAEQAGLGRLLEEDWIAAPVDLLLFPHHGSHTPFLAALLRRLTPEELWVSVDREPAVAPELKRRRLRFLRTGTSGPLLWTAGGRGAAARSRVSSAGVPSDDARRNPPRRSAPDRHVTGSGRKAGNPSGVGTYRSRGSPSDARTCDPPSTANGP